jgi:hypothetical protein
MEAVMESMSVMEVGGVEKTERWGTDLTTSHMPATAPLIIRQEAAATKCHEVYYRAKFTLGYHVGKGVGIRT